MGALEVTRVAPGRDRIVLRHARHVAAAGAIINPALSFARGPWEKSIPSRVTQ
jgi:hypothetical protein